MDKWVSIKPHIEKDYIYVIILFSITGFHLITLYKLDYG